MAVGEWDQRQLCPDGGCVGVIGPDGTCKVCGRAAANWGDERKRGLIDPEEDVDDEDDEEEEFIAGHDAGYDDDEDDEDDDDDDDDGVPDVVAVASMSPNDWSARRLCPDGACIGLIGLDGRCKVCGRTASGSKDAVSPTEQGKVAAEPAAAEPAAAELAATPTAAAPAAVGTSPGAAGIAGESPSDPAAAVPAAGAVSVDPESTLVPCSDPACAGTSDRDGHCNVCGKVVA